MNKLYRHIGFTQTGARVAVILLRVPDREDHCLVVWRDSVPTKYHAIFEEFLMGPAQSTPNIYELLQKYRLNNGTPLVNELFNARVIDAVPISNVTMSISSNQNISLEELLVEMDKLNPQVETPSPETVTPSPETLATPSPETTETLPVVPETDDLSPQEIYNYAKRMVNVGAALKRKLEKEYPNIKEETKNTEKPKKAANKK